jgi:hypothetical protein
MTTKEIEEHSPEFERPDPNKMYSDDWRVRERYRKEKLGI